MSALHLYITSALVAYTVSRKQSRQKNKDQGLLSLICNHVIIKFLLYTITLGSASFSVGFLCI